MPLSLDQEFSFMSDGDGVPAANASPWWCPEPSVASAQVKKLVDRARALADATAQASGNRSIESVGICGAGIMGASIAAATIHAGIPVRLHDKVADALEKGMRAAREESEQLAHCGSGKIRVGAGAALIRCRALTELAACDLVIECIVEDREVKCGVLNQLGSLMRRNGVLATNTSTIRIADLATATGRPDRFCGIHFFVPVGRRPLVEVVRGESSGDGAIATAVALVNRLGKYPTVVRDCPGFVINRLLLPYLSEAQEMVCQGVSMELIDRAATRFGMTLGPFQLIDAIGVDTSLLSGRVMWEAFPTRVALTPILRALVKRGRLGRKTGLGFYRYNEGSDEAQADPDVFRILEPYIRPILDYTETDIVMRLFLAMFLEATRILEEQVVSSPSEVDFAILNGLGFPKSRAGLVYWADGFGAAGIIQRLKRFEDLGQRMQPTELLQSLAATGKRFFSREDGAAHDFGCT